MKIREITNKCVRKFNLDNTAEVEEYKVILNNPNYTITRDEFTYDKFGHALITIWYEKEEAS